MDYIWTGRKHSFCTLPLPPNEEGKSVTYNFLNFNILKTGQEGGKNTPHLLLYCPMLSYWTKVLQVRDLSPVKEPYQGMDLIFVCLHCSSRTR